MIGPVRVSTAAYMVLLHLMNCAVKNIDGRSKGHTARLVMKESMTRNQAVDLVDLLTDSLADMHIEPTEQAAINELQEAVDYRPTSGPRRGRHGPELGPIDPQQP